MGATRDRSPLRVAQARGEKVVEGYVGALASAAIEGGVEMVTWPAIETKQTGVPAASPRSWFGSILSLVADYAATGLPPAYLPKHDADDEPSEDP